MIETTFNYEEYEKNRIIASKAVGLRFVPEGVGPKVYAVICKDKNDWNEIHNYIIEENEIDGIPNRKIECPDECKTCDRMASYEISDAEAEQLRDHPKIIGVSIDEGYYEGTFKGRDTFPSKIFRYPANMGPNAGVSTIAGDILNVRERQQSGVFGGNPTFDSMGRSTSNILRHQQANDPWSGSSDTTIIADNPEYNGDGTDVDVIVADSAAWIGHIEFIKTGEGEPAHYIGGNVLRSGFSTSSTTGVCGVLDLILDAPYYIDPEFFEANVGTALTTRWDGTKVPTETAAINWWNNESTTYRSAKYVSTNISGGTATIGSNEDFGVIAIGSNYSRVRANGSNSAYNTGTYDSSPATHGTACASLAYGKTQGWAFNSNKWYVSIIWDTTGDAISDDNLWKVTKVFHQLKPNRSADDTKNPTLISNSWGTIATLPTFGYYYWRGDDPVFWTYSGGTRPAWLDNFRSTNDYPNGVAYSRFKPTTSSDVVLGASMVDAGVIMFGSAGNNNQQMVLDGHANYDNYVGTNPVTTLNQAMSQAKIINRPGYPVCIGLVENYNGSGVDKYRGFNVGCLDNDKVSNTQEQKATYSNMGNGIDFYTVGDEASAAARYLADYARYDDYYRIDSNYDIVTSGGTESVQCRDISFNGTSAACPIGVGLIATVLQSNRNWTWSNIKDWLENKVTNQSSSAFFTGTEATSPTDTNWNSTRNLQGGTRKILFDANDPDIIKCSVKGSLTISGGDITIT